MNAKLLIIIIIILESTFLFFSTQEDLKRSLRYEAGNYSMIIDEAAEEITKTVRSLKGSKTSFRNKCAEEFFQDDTRTYPQFILDEAYYIDNGRLTIDKSEAVLALVQDSLNNCITGIELPQSYLTSFPSLLNTFPNLEKLALNGNQIRNLENLEDFNELKHLDLSYNDLFFIGDNILKLKNLETLDLTGNSNLKLITPKIKELTNLKTLTVAFTPYHDKRKLRGLRRLLPNVDIFVVE